MNELKLQNGMNILRNGSKLGSLHIFVDEKGIYEITLFNAKISKKETHTHKFSENSHHVNLEIKIDKA